MACSLCRQARTAAGEAIRYVAAGKMADAAQSARKAAGHMAAKMDEVRQVKRPQRPW